ncbi:MAG: DUF3373 family protein [Desulfobacula sp.]|jgi:hypothetical protein|uniref:DUF3373 family protein n=1 Tax=Desulfobacula sp. TaxID=2593537 RepID=UPI002A16FEB7|nr:DUF3373 family protein [Desulfobacula sp.]MBT7794950.1 DUF3373 family protein [Desulfobacula sp.]
MKKVFVYFLFSVFFLSSPAFAAEDMEILKNELKKMSQTMEALQEKIETMEKENKEEKEDVQYLSDRVDKAELHTVTDRVSLGVEVRAEGHSLHYDNMQVAPSSLVQGFFTPYASGGFNGGTLSEIQTRIGGMVASGMVPPTEKYDADNDFLPTTKFHLNMKAKVNNNLTFNGRLAAYKVWGDSSGIKTNTGSLGDVTLDGNTSSVPHGDTITLERAYFLYSKNIDEIPVSFSLGRRPSTDGPPMEYGKNSLEAGSPLSTIINWQFDGASLNFGLEEALNISGAAFKFCYGLGFEGGWGNSYSLQNTSSYVDDVHMFGVIATIYDDDAFSAVFNYAHAWDITDGFTGLTLMPFIPYKNADGTYSFDQNVGGYISRMQPVTEIGDWDGASLLLRSNLDERVGKDIDVFMAISWSHTDPSQISQNPFYEIMGQGLLSSNGKLEAHDGYSIYAGVLFPMPLDAKLGLEYNWGSEYWFNFTGAEDSIAGSKLAARGSVVETYYIQPIISDNFFLKLGMKYFDYEYTGSGNPLGAPEKISELSSLNAIFPVVDKVWDLSASITMRF